MGNILKRYEIIIKAISISNAWHALYLTKYGTFGFLANPANKIINNKKLPKGKDFSIIAIGKVRNNSIFIFTLCIFIYSISQCIFGVEPEIPLISKSVRMQI